MTDLVFVLNAGSSSLKFAAYDAATGAPYLRGAFEDLGRRPCLLRTEGQDEPPAAIPLDLADHGAAARHLAEGIERRGLVLRAIGHRLVRGGPGHDGPRRIDQPLIDQLQALSATAPAHLPAELAIITLFGARFPSLPQIACFDTAFHRTMPGVARRLPLPRRLTQNGLERFGFHGLSCTSLVDTLEREAGPEAAAGRLILAHLGSGSSLTAVRGRRSIDTTMGFTTSGGIPMATRSGDLDPGIAYYLERTEGINARAFNDMINTASGLLGISETSGDVRQLLDRAADPRAAEAIDYYCYRIRQAIGALAASLGGLDTLVFSGGVGQNAPAIRSRACAALGFLGIALDEAANGANAALISAPTSHVAVRVIRTDEEAVILDAVRAMLAADDRLGGPIR